MSVARLAPRARQDLLEIAAFIREDRETAADAFIDRVRQLCEALAANPEMGRMRPELGPRLRSFTVGNHVLFYVPVVSGVDVVRILHGARDLPTALGVPLPGPSEKRE